MIELHDLLDSCARSTPPDYYRFYAGVQAILSKCERPKSFCDAFASALRECEVSVREYSVRAERGDVISREEILPAKLAFHKYKLLLGCGEKLPSAMQVLISEKSGCSITDR